MELLYDDLVFYLIKFLSDNDKISFLNSHKQFFELKQFIILEKQFDFIKYPKIVNLSFFYSIRKLIIRNPWWNKKILSDKILSDKIKSKLSLSNITHLTIDDNQNILS